MKKCKAVIVGAGHRALLYASYAKEHPDELEIAGVADPAELRRQAAASDFQIPEARCFASAEELATKEKFADFIINGTMDQQHVATSLPLLQAGYDILLEKPFATNQEEMWALVGCAREYKRKIAICHVLRYAPFYQEIRQRILNNEIGSIINIQAIEHVSYHHMAVGYVRGKWSKKDYCNSTMLMAKSCHDLDLVAWMKSGISPLKVASFGSNFQFNQGKKPEGAGKRCLVDCKIEADCLYSARKHYLEHPERWAFYVWESLEHLPNPTIKDKEDALKTNAYGRCVWQCDNDVVDHQSLVIEFEDGSTATLNMIGGASKPSRSIHIIGTRGEIQGCFEDSKFVVRHIEAEAGCEYSEEVVDLNISGDMTGAFGGHGGGDLKLVEDFIQIIKGEKPSISSTTIEDSIYGHLLGFSADEAREKNKVIELKFQPGYGITSTRA